MSNCTPKTPETFLRLLECVSQRVYRHFAIENTTENDPDTLCTVLRPPSLIQRNALFWSDGDIMMAHNELEGHNQGRSTPAPYVRER